MQVESAMAKWSGPPLDLSLVNICPGETQQRWTSIQKSPKKQQYLKEQRFGSDGLPFDPREWTRTHVWTWLINMAKSERLEPTPELAQKFPMNGKALCLMTLDMYLSRVPNGGKMLYRDFRLRLTRAMSL